MRGQAECEICGLGNTKSYPNVETLDSPKSPLGTASLQPLSLVLVTGKMSELPVGLKSALRLVSALASCRDRDLFAFRNRPLIPNFGVTPALSAACLRKDRWERLFPYWERSFSLWERSFPPVNNSANSQDASRTVVHLCSQTLLSGASVSLSRWHRPCE